MPPNAVDVLLPAEEVMIQVTSVDQKEQDVSSTEDETQSCGKKQYLYGAGDSVFAMLVVAPLVVGFWRGTWTLMDLQPRAFPYAQTFVMGIVIHVCFALTRSHLLARSTHAWRGNSDGGGAARWFRERVVSRIYTYVFGVANIMHWRGGWGLMDAAVARILPDEDDPHRPVLTAAITIFCYVSMAYLRSSRNILAPPFFVFPDSKESTYLFATRFKKSNSRDTVLYVMDCLFSVGVVGTLVVLVWRGSWAILDVYLLPDDKLRSYWTSMVAGYTLVCLTFGAQGAARWAAARLHGAARLLLADVYHLISFLATVNLWRGIWGVLDEYLYPENPKLSNWLTHSISMLALILLNCSNSVLVRGVYIDAEEPGGECVVFPCHYIRYYYHRDKTTKREQKERKGQEDATLAPLQNAEEKGLDEKVTCCGEKSETA